MLLPKVTIQIVTWNSVRHLSNCLESVFNQTYRDFQVLVIDNNSQDQTVKFLKANYPHVTVFQNNKNLGFAKANNQGIKLLNSPYVLICNPDIILNNDWLEKMMAVVENSDYASYGSFGGKLLKMDLVDNEISEVRLTENIDSCGIKILKSHRAVELGVGHKSNEYQARRDVFGQSGSLVLFRKEALEEAMISIGQRSTGEYFDEDFFFYKEDVDLGWRLQLLGWKSVFIPEAIAHHVRSLGGSDKQSFGQIIKNRRSQSKLARYYSYRNHLLFLIKDEYFVNFFRYLPSIAWYELKKFCYILFFEWSSLSSIGEVIKLTPKMLKKRRLIFKKKKTGVQYIRQWIE